MGDFEGCDTTLLRLEWSRGEWMWSASHQGGSVVLHRLTADQVCVVASVRRSGIYVGTHFNAYAPIESPLDSLAAKAERLLGHLFGELLAEEMGADEVRCG